MLAPVAANSRVVDVSMRGCNNGFISGGELPVLHADPDALDSAQMDRRPLLAESPRLSINADRLLEDWAEQLPRRRSAEDRREAILRRQARRQALLLLMASASVSLAILYGLWTGLHGLL